MTATNYVHVLGTPILEGVLTTGSTEEQPLPTNEPELVAFGNALLRHLLDAQQEKSANDAALEVEVQRLRAAYGDTNRPLIRQQEYLTRELERVASALKPFFRGKKGRSLPSGYLGWKKVNARLEVTDPDAVMNWALQQDDDVALVLTKVTQKRSVVKAAVDEYWKTTGEIPPGCELVPENEKFECRPAASAPDTAAA